jgi:hypothetical protein
MGQNMTIDLILEVDDDDAFIMYVMYSDITETSGPPE